MGRTITKEEVAKLDTEEFKGQICEVQTLEEVNKAIEYLSKFELVGFDTETRPAFRKGNTHDVALIQLSTDDVCILFRLNKIDSFPPSLIQFLSNPKPLKIGLSLKDDFCSINRKQQFTPAGFIDIQKLVKEHDIDDMSLQKIYALLFEKKISKSQRLSNWEADALTESQKKYAALDAWACLKIYKKLCLTKKYT